MAYEFKIDDVYGLASSLGTTVKIKGDELFFNYCPYCKGGGHDKDTLSVNADTGAFKCFRGGCGKQGHFVEMARDFGYTLDFGIMENKKYKTLRQKEIIVRSPAVEYLKSRGISEGTCNQYKITTQTANDNILVFPFYDADGVMVCVKYRKTNFVKGKDKSKEWFEADTKPILFGMWQCKDFSQLIITEGQLDSLSIADCGINNAVSVPTGANGFTWVQHCYDWVNKFSEIIIFGDNEKGKITLVEQISRHFSHKQIKIVRPQDYLGEKDANDIYCKYGKAAIQACIDNAEIKPVRAVKRLADVKAVDLESMEHIKTGIHDIDRVIGGMYPGQVIILTGKCGEGKSTLASQILVNALEQGYSFFAYSGELPDYQFKRWLDLQIAGSENIITRCNEYGDESYSIPNNVIEQINTWYSDKAYIFDNNIIGEEMQSDKGNEITLLGTIEETICRYGTKVILLDNLMTALDVDLSNDLYRAQSEFLKKVKHIAVKYEVAVILIAHPRKTQDKELDNNSISGSGDITNRVDLVVTYQSNTEADKDEYQSKITITKNRLSGRKILGNDAIKVRYSGKSKRIICDNDNSCKIYSCFGTNSNFMALEEPPF